MALEGLRHLAEAGQQSDAPQRHAIVSQEDPCGASKEEGAQGVAPQLPQKAHLRRQQHRHCCHPQRLLGHREGQAHRHRQQGLLQAWHAGGIAEAGGFGGTAAERQIPRGGRAQREAGLHSAEAPHKDGCHVGASCQHHVRQAQRAHALPGLQHSRGLPCSHAESHQDLQVARDAELVAQHQNDAAEEDALQKPTAFVEEKVLRIKRLKDGVLGQILWRCAAHEEFEEGFEEGGQHVHGDDQQTNHQLPLKTSELEVPVLRLQVSIAQQEQSHRLHAVAQPEADHPRVLFFAEGRRVVPRGIPIRVVEGVQKHVEEQDPGDCKAVHALDECKLLVFGVVHIPHPTQRVHCLLGRGFLCRLIHRHRQSRGGVPHGDLVGLVDVQGLQVHSLGQADASRLPSGALGDVLHEEDGLRQPLLAHLLRGEAAKLFQASARDLLSLSEHCSQADGLTQLHVWTAKGDAVEDRGPLAAHVLHLEGRDLLTAPVNDLFVAPREAQVVVLIDVAFVSGAKPAIWGKGFDVRVLVHVGAHFVTLGNAGAPYTDFCLFSWLHRCVAPLVPQSHARARGLPHAPQHS
mmetsp:Transcript_636/g.1338  ORF Transcript_636/g.1338 Transcript_636/m.1338 type:complete len:575 (+) Transcript_636:190-1914(+)